MPRLPWWGTVAGLVAVALVAWRVSACPHTGPLGLLPATRDLDGHLLPPRWHCDACGRTWAASFERAQVPVQKYVGYDESKAVLAAKRAAELTERQREMALRRAGLGAARRPRPTRVPADVVPIRSERLAR